MALSGESILADGISFEVLMWEHSGPLGRPSPKGRCYRRRERGGLREQSGFVDVRAEAEGHGRPRAPEAEGAGRVPPAVLHRSEALQPADLVLNGDVPVWCVAPPVRGWVLWRLIQDANAPREVSAWIPRGGCRRGRPLCPEACEQCRGATGRAWAVAWTRGQGGPRKPEGLGDALVHGAPTGCRGAQERPCEPAVGLTRAMTASVAESGTPPSKCSGSSSLCESCHSAQSAAGERAQRDPFADAGHAVHVQGAKAGREAVTAFPKVPVPFSPPANACGGGGGDRHPGPRGAGQTGRAHSALTLTSNQGTG